MARERALSAAQLNLLDKARGPAGVLLSGFDGEDVTARSLAKRGLVTRTATSVDGRKMWRIERTRRTTDMNPHD